MTGLPIPTQEEFMRVIKFCALAVLIGVDGLPLITPNFGSRFEDLAKMHKCVYVDDILGGIFGRSENWFPRIGSW